MSVARELLILKYENFQTDLPVFFKTLKYDKEVQKLFFTNPSLVLRTKLPSLGTRDFDIQHDAAANRILFSVLSNDRFMEFLSDYQVKKVNAMKRLIKSPGDRKAALELNEKTIRLQFADAMLKYGDKEILSNIFGVNMSSAQLKNTLNFFVIFILIIIVIVIIHALVFLGTSGDLLPTRAKAPISAAELRKIANQLIAAAKAARESGKLLE
jgi:hypothetical protein